MFEHHGVISELSLDPAKVELELSPRQGVTFVLSAQS